MVLDSILHQCFLTVGWTVIQDNQIIIFWWTQGYVCGKGIEFEISHQQCLEFLDDSLMGLLLNACQRYFFLQQFQFLKEEGGAGS